MATTLHPDPGLRPTQPRSARVGIAVAAPLAGVALAYALWWISDRLLYIGPLDRATFGWLVVVPVWALSPMVAAYAWRPLSRRETVLAATVVGVVISIAASLLFWLAVAHPACEFGAVRTPAELIAPSLLVGIVVGGGLAGMCVATLATLRQGRWWSAILVAAGSGLALVFLAILAAAPSLMSSGCQRPPV